MWMIYPLIFLGGFVDAIAGGGGLISVTAYMAIGLPPHMSLGTNKFSAVFGTGMSTLRFARSGNVRWDSAILAFVGALVGSALGARLALLIDERVLSYLIIALVPILVVFMLVKKDFGGKQTKDLGRGKVLVYSLLVGVVVGGYDGFFGPGAGTFMIMAFTGVLGFTMLTACGNAKVVNFGSNLAAVVTFLYNGEVDLKLGVPCALCGLLGSYVGAGLALKRGVKIVRPMMILVILGLLVKIIWDLTR